MFHKLRHSFSARLSFFILLFTVVIFVAAFSVFNYFSNRTIEKGAQTESERILQIINLQIKNVLRRVETVPNNLNWIVTNHGIAADSMYGITQNVVRNNPDIFGSAIAFEPYYFKEKGYYFSPYSYRNGDTIRSLQLGNPDYDYFSWAWYSEPKKLGAPCWSEPYYDTGGGQMMMCTYSTPIFDSEGTLIGIFTSDIALNWLTDLIDAMSESDQPRIFVLSKDGTFIVHKQRERILHQTIFDLAEETNNLNYKTLGENMTAGKQGMFLIKNDKEKSFVFYAPVPRTNWSLGIIIPKKVVFSDLHRINWIMFLIVVLGLIALFVICSRIITSLTLPLKIFAASSREIAQGNFSAQLPHIHSKDEMKELHDSFAYMQLELTNYIDNLQKTTSAKEKIESELRIARDIQMSMLPKLFPSSSNHNEIDLYATLNPAKEVGGDLYDFFLKEDHLYFAIGDVSGKGMPASLLMAITLTLFRSVAGRKESPAAIMNSLNNYLTENNASNMFATLLIGVLNLKTGILTYCNAGHNPPVIVTPDNECKWLNITPNLPVGVLKEFPYKEQNLALPDASKLILYTDGVTEAESIDKELYGKKRLLTFIQQNSKLSPLNMIEDLLSGINQYITTNNPSDDIAVMVLDFNRNRSNRLIIKNKIEEIEKIATFVEQIGEGMNLPLEWVMKLNLALEEAVTNTILYGFESRKQKAESRKEEGESRKEEAEGEEIEVGFSREGETLVFTIVDEGREFDLTLEDDPDITLSVEERPVGGLGIFLIKQIMDEIEYRREDGKNILVMSKNIININQ